MKKPNREPDFTWMIHAFWIEPEMIMWDGQRKDYDKLIDIKGVLHYIPGLAYSPDLLRDEIQESYCLYIENKVEEILLGSETESK